MQIQTRLYTKAEKSARPASHNLVMSHIRGREEARRFPVCVDCPTVNTTDLLKIRDGSGYLYLCKPHAALRGIA